MKNLKNRLSFKEAVGSDQQKVPDHRSCKKVPDICLPEPRECHFQRGILSVLWVMYLLGCRCIHGNGSLCAHPYSAIYTVHISVQYVKDSKCGCTPSMWDYNFLLPHQSGGLWELQSNTSGGYKIRGGGIYNVSVEFSKRCLWDIRR